jgi:hypothetical protein
MKHGVLFATVGALAFALTAHAITVDGYVFLSGQADHTGTLIMFRAVSPSARTDSTHSFNTGYFTVALQPGVYDVEFSNDGYAPITLQDQVLLFDMTLQTQELMPALSGYVSGTLGPGDFDVWDTLRVGEGSQFQILPGTRLHFRDRIPLIVRGRLSAVGTEQDSILFTLRDLDGNTAWGGIRFDYMADSGRFEYCILERGVWYANGTVSSLYTPLTMAHCEVRRNNATAGYATGVACFGGSLVLDQCVFRGNQASWTPAVYLSGTAANVSDCVFDSNTAGIGSSGQSAWIHHCVFMKTGPAYEDHGQAIACAGGLIENCVVFGSSYYGQAVSCSDTAMLRRCTIRGGFRCGEDAVISSCVIAFADNQNRDGVEFYYPRNARVEHCCIYGNAGGNFSGSVPAGIGIVALTNANGDSCDTYYNIFLDPQFVDRAAGDYHLTLGSPCIDAGDPNLPPDPDATVADMGAFYFNQLAVPDPERTAVRHYRLGQNYPNPFNAETRIAFDLARAGEVTLEVFDITGRLVRRLVDGSIAEGTHEISLDARDLPSGVYVYRLAAGEIIEARKMILIR